MCLPIDIIASFYSYNFVIFIFIFQCILVKLYNMKSTAKSDYDRRFQEDLEKAQALSLETLALEEFRNRKLQSESSTCTGSAVVSTSSLPTHSMSLTGFYICVLF